MPDWGRAHELNTAAMAPVWREALPVRRWMRSPVVTIRATTRVIRAARTLRERKIRHLAVVDRSGRLIGIVSERDLRQAVFNAAVERELAPALAAVRKLRVRDVMTWNVVTAGPDTDLRDAARLMRERAIGALPIVVDGALVGLLTVDDVLAALEELLAARVTTIEPMRGVADGDPWGYGFPDLTPSAPWQDTGSGAD